nr:MAG TPA: hypothetical protein [Myoviridae sp. ctyhU11]DAN45252.1 MAG TPA: hypothetical protein [Caudoviricetes sp.]
MTIHQKSKGARAFERKNRACTANLHNISG